MQLYTHTLPSGAKLTGYLRDETNEMPAFNIRPAMLILPGGGYAFCSAREADPIAMQFLQAGYQTFVLEYTCAHTPEQAPLRWQPLIDAAGAILHLRPTAILWDAAPVQKALGITAEEARPDAVVLGYPVITSGIKTHGGSIANLAGDDTALQAIFSLENQVRGDLPPFFIWHTVADQAVPVENSLLLASALTENHVPYELHLFTHGGHGSSTCTQEVNTPNRHNAAWVSLCTDWLAETLHFHL